MIPVLFLLIGFANTVLQSKFIFGGDSAEFATIAKTWGIAHPPGYPLYSFFINIIDRIVPFGTTPWKITLLSSITTVITAYFIYKILCLIKIQKYFAVASSFLYLVLFPIWQYALIPEVFGLHTMLIVLITYALLRYSQNNKNKLLLFASFFGGLSISHHHIFVLFIPGWLYLLQGKIKDIYQNKKLCIRMLALIFLGASFYLYAITASLNHTLLDWENAKTLEGFFRLITRASYGSFKAYSNSGAHIVNQLLDMVSGLTFILLDFKPLGIIFISIGLYVSKKYSQRFARFLFVSLLFHFFFLFYTNFVLTSSASSGMFERFLIPLYLILIFFLAIGFDYIYKEYFLRVTKLLNNTNLKKGAQVSYFLFIGIFIMIIAMPNYKAISLIARENAFEKLGKDIIDTVPMGGILTTQSDTPTFASYYHLYGLGARKDIVLLQLGIMHRANFIEMIKKRSPNLIISAPITGDGDFEKFILRNKERGYYAEREMAIGTWRPYGLLWKYYPDALSTASDSAMLLANNKRLWEHTYTIPELAPEAKNIFHLNSVREYYLNAYENYSKLLVVMEKYNEAEVVLKNIVQKYKRGDLQSKAVYLNILVHQKKCAEASNVAKKINLASTIKKYPGFVNSALTYLRTCEPQNKLIPEYMRKLKELEKSVKTDLNTF